MHCLKVTQSGDLRRSRTPQYRLIDMLKPRKREATRCSPGD